MAYAVSKSLDFEQELLECILLKEKLMKSKSFLVGDIYKPPNSGIVWNYIFEDYLENA